MNREIGLTVEQRYFKFLREQTFGQARIGLGHGRRLKFIASGLDDLEVKLQFRKSVPALRQNHVRLRECQRATARGNGDGAFGGHENQVVVWVLAGAGC